MELNQLVDNGKIHCQVWHRKEPTFQCRKEPLPEDLKTEYELVANYAIELPEVKEGCNPVTNACDRIFLETQNTDDRAWHESMDGMRSTSVGDLIAVMQPSCGVISMIHEVAPTGFKQLL